MRSLGPLDLTWWPRIRHTRTDIPSIDCESDGRQYRIWTCWQSEQQLNAFAFDGLEVAVLILTAFRKFDFPRIFETSCPASARSAKCLFLAYNLGHKIAFNGQSSDFKFGPLCMHEPLSYNPNVNSAVIAHSPFITWSLT